MQRVKLAILAFFIVSGLFGYLADSRSSGMAQALGGTFSAPTNVTASDGDYSTKVGLHWDTIRNATRYRIFRNSTNDSGTALDVGTTTANYFFDSTAVAAQSYYYWIRSEYNRLSVDEKKSLIGSAMFIFLNKTCFRGIFRVGPNGFNVPYGWNKNPDIIDVGHVHEISELIKNVNFRIV